MRETGARSDVLVLSHRKHLASKLEQAAQGVLLAPRCLDMTASKLAGKCPQLLARARGGTHGVPGAVEGFCSRDCESRRAQQEQKQAVNAQLHISSSAAFERCTVLRSSCFEVVLAAPDVLIRLKIAGFVHVSGAIISVPLTASLTSTAGRAPNMECAHVITARTP